MISIIKNNTRRAFASPSLLFTIIILTAGAIAAALFFSSRSETAANIALVTETETAVPDYENLNLTILDETPLRSELIAGTYDAIITMNRDGSFEIDTVKNEAFHNMIAAVLETGTAPEADALEVRGTGATILGFLMMFLLMESSSLMFMFGQDKEHHQIRRVLSTPLSITKYLAGHCLFNFLYVFIITLTVLYAFRLITGIDIGFTFAQYSLLIALILALGTSLSLFLNAMTAKSDNANMLGSSIIVLTTILSGSFYAFEQGNALLGRIIRFLPQKAVLNIIENIEQGQATSDSAGYILYLAAVILLFTGAAVLKTRKEYVQG